MPANPLKDRRFVLTPVDRQVMDPEHGAANDISWWAKLYFDLDVFPWQHYFYHHPAKDKMIVAGIRTGKSKVAGMGDLHYAQFHPGARILNTSISSEQAKIVYYNVLELATQDRFRHWIERIEKSPYPMIRLINGTEMWFRSIGYEAELLRGFEFDLISVDEAAYIQSEMAINTLKGRLLGVNPATQRPRAGLIWYMTSPKGKTGWLYERWKKGDPRYPQADPQRYLSLRVRTIDNPKLDQEALREIMLDYTDKMIEQELEGEFIDSDTAEFTMDQIMPCCSDLDPHVRLLHEEINRWRERQGRKRSLKLELGLAEEIEHYELDPRPGRMYLASWDLGKKATKEGRNATVGMVFDITELPWKMVAYRYVTGTGYLQAMQLIEQWQAKYSNVGSTCYTVMDGTGKGDVLNEIIEAENRFQVEGIVYNASLKPNLITAGKVIIERQMVRFPFIKRFVDQLSIYEQADKDLPQDTVMAFCQFAYKARELTGLSSPKPAMAAPLLYRRSPQILYPDVNERFVARRRESLYRRSRRVS